jgi:hypothetical protein
MNVPFTKLFLVLFLVQSLSFSITAFAADIDGDQLDSVYDLDDTNIDADDDGIFDLYDYDQDGDNIGDNAIAVDSDSDGIHDDADADDTYPSGAPSFITQRTVGVGGDITSLAAYLNVDQEESTALDGGLYFVDSIYDDYGSGNEPNLTKTNTYVEPTATELTNFESLLTLIEARQFFAASQIAEDMNGDGNATGGDDYDYDIVHYVAVTPTDPVTHDVYCLEESSGFAAGRGVFCINFSADDNHHISLPHPEYDSQSDDQGAKVFWETPTRYLSMSTTHRCGVSTLSACGGTTSVCSCKGPECNDGDPDDPGIEGTQEFRISDMAHAVDTFFFDFGAFVEDQNYESDMSTKTNLDIYTIQLHGCSDTSCPDNHGDSSTTSADNDPYDDDQLDGTIADNIIFRLSNGTTDNFTLEGILGDNEIVNQFQIFLQAAMDVIGGGSGLGAMVRSCNLSTHVTDPGSSTSGTNAVTDFYDDKLCGTTNPLGRYINGLKTGTYSVTDPNDGVTPVDVAVACESASGDDPDETDAIGAYFLHVEQSYESRDDDGVLDDYNYQHIVDVIEDRLPSANPIYSDARNTTDTDGDGILDEYDPFDDTVDGDSDGLPFGIDPDDADDDYDDDGILDGVDYSLARVAVNGVDIFNGKDVNANGLKDSTELPSGSLTYTREFIESTADDGSFLSSGRGSSVTITLSGDEIFSVTSTDLTSGVDYSITNGPVGSTPTLSIDVTGLIATLTFSAASTHDEASSYANLGIVFADSAFAGGMLASNVTNSTISDLSVSFVDSDNVDFDGVADADEDGTNGFILNDGDGNDDNVADVLQAAVATLPGSDVGVPFAIEVGGSSCEVIQSLDDLTEGTDGTTDSDDYVFSLGLLDFELSCENSGESASVTVFYDKNYSGDADFPSEDWTFVKWDGSAYVEMGTQPVVSVHTFGVDGTGTGTDSVANTQVTKVTYSLTDGGLNDSDSAADGVISDPFGPTIAQVNTTSTTTTTTTSTNQGTVAILIQQLLNQEEEAERVLNVDYDLDWDDFTCELVLSGADFFEDMTTSEWFACSSYRLFELDVISGFEDEKGELTGELKPAQDVTYAEALKMVLEFAQVLVEENASYELEHLSAEGAWFEAYVAAYESIDSDLFPTDLDFNEAISRAEVMQLFVDVLELSPSAENEAVDFLDVSISTSYMEAIDIMSSHEWIEGSRNEEEELTYLFGPADSLNRAELFTLIDRLLETSVMD